MVSKHRGRAWHSGGEERDVKRTLASTASALGLVLSLTPTTTASASSGREPVPVVVCATTLGVVRPLPTLPATSTVWVPSGWAGKVSLYRDALGRQVGQLAPTGLKCQAVDFADGRSIIEVAGTQTVGGFHGFSSALVGPCLSCLVTDLWPFLSAAQHARYASYRPMMMPGLGVRTVRFLHRSPDTRSGTVIYQQSTEAMAGPPPSVAINYRLATATAQQETCAVATTTASLCRALLAHWNEYYPYRVG